MSFTLRKAFLALKQLPSLWTRNHFASTASTSSQQTMRDGHRRSERSALMYQVRRVTIGQTEQLDDLARECGRLYSQTVVFFWRTVRHKGIWLKPKHLMRLFTSRKLHAHTSDTCVQAFFASLKAWRVRKQAGDPTVNPPHKRKWYFRIEYKRSAMSLKEGSLRLSNGSGVSHIQLRYYIYLGCLVLHRGLFAWCICS